MPEAHTPVRFNMLTVALARVSWQESLERDAIGVAFVFGGSVGGYGRGPKYACDEEKASTVPPSVAGLANCGSFACVWSPV